MTSEVTYQCSISKAQKRSAAQPSLPPILPMATFNLSSPKHPNSPFVSSNVPSRISPVVAFYPIPKSSFLLSSISLRLRPITIKTESKTKARGSSYVVSALKKLSDADLVTVPPETEAIPGLFPSDAGVYAVYDGNGDLQFVGISRNVAASVLSHRKSVPELCSSVKVFELAPYCNLLVGFGS